MRAHMSQATPLHGSCQPKSSLPDGPAGAPQALGCGPGEHSLRRSPCNLKQYA